MAYEKLPHRIAIVGTALLLLTIDCHAQDPPQDHSCTVNVAGAADIPSGKDGKNFSTGWGFQAGGGFAVTAPLEPRHGINLYITGNFMYGRFNATSDALSQAKAANTMQLGPATSAHGSFSAATLDPAVRYPISIRTSLYLLGGFGWFRRGVGFNGANSSTLTQSSGITLDRLTANSGVFDFGGGVNVGLTRRGGLMLYVEARVYRGVAVNSGTTLLPLSLGVRW
jgi:hypothetical protein